MRNRLALVLAAAAALSLGACANTLDDELGAGVDSGTFGNATMNNSMVQTGQISATRQLATRFAAEVPDTINFAFNSSQLTPEAQDILRRQAHWIRQFPEVRFRVFGHTDLVGSNSYNKALGLRRAKAVVAYLAQNGVSSSRVEAVVSYGKTQPIIQTNAAEVRNRRTVTEVSGFVDRSPTLLNGKYAEVIFREYLVLGERRHPPNVPTETQTNPAGG
ncbi:MAG: OmpA family protein [Pseudomonadota bacterium]